MPVIWLVLIVLALGAGGYVLGRSRALGSAGGDSRKLHSLPNYYGSNVAIKTLVPSFLVLAIWLIAQPIFVSSQISGQLPDGIVPEGSSVGLVMAEVRRTADGIGALVANGTMSADMAASAQVDPVDLTARLQEAGQVVTSAITQPILQAAQSYRAMNATGGMAMTALVLLIALGGLVYGLRETAPQFRARNVVEGSVRVLLIAAASLAILTTIGIVLSLLFNTVEFFRIYPASDFFGSLTWSPSFQGNSQLGIWPLLWGTLYISIIALTVAVPIGLFAAIYLSEYASKAVRSTAKPLLEILAGIPTIVYGLFALLTVGPMLMRVFGDEGIGWMQSGTAVMTAGLVMGIMLIPFVSSLSDDIINAVPQAMRDGSLGLGATKSETIRQVVLPAALPGIVGAILLAASRAIGETMIVVLGAGAAARLSMNPFDAMTTVTAKIVSQLTGDSDFASPEALVAFALGMTLFVITLGLNVFALYIVRKYREQYE
ncbi:phosphate ABC transporter permease subunit PstC [Roseibaca sp. Y0-43]|uniref:phosphate ABC transporter permease subunit PstC n=1 Tax=Roseibaca sp. Y0-43 TaxID=2816854 RepID=UPI001D0C6470|nr:phosphate ABC transporter permease subunit PstC [Roseibaca sp. Y0-43]MCC1480974.1 phosphate ABC transporter permease subunit PstC [Roseibaca sp. Y0-43]